MATVDLHEHGTKGKCSVAKIEEYMLILIENIFAYMET